MAPLDSLTRPVGVGVQAAAAAWPQFVRPLFIELVSRRPIREILPGVHHWIAFHPRNRQPVSSYYVEAAGAVLDPVVPREGLEWFEGREPPRELILTNRHHYRQSDRFVEAFGGRVRCCEAGLHEFVGGPRKVEGFAFGEEVAPGITAHQVGAICPDDTAMHIQAGAGALAFADGLTRPRGGGLTIVPGFLLGDDADAVRAGLRESFRRLLELDFDGLLFAHGEPVAEGGKSALREFTEKR